METVSPPSAKVLADLRALPGVSDVVVKDGYLRVTSSGQHALTGQIVNIATREGDLRTIAQREPNLDEIFLRLTGSALRD